eukprot:372895-Amphidinium_carterae.1
MTVDDEFAVACSCKKVSSPNPREATAAVAAPLFTEAAEPEVAFSSPFALLHSRDVLVDADLTVPSDAEGAIPEDQPEVVPSMVLHGHPRCG